MALPEREYYFLDEVMAQLPLTKRDVQYYICHGYLPTSVWIPRTEFTDNTDNMPYRGYVYLDPDVCFELFQHGKVEARSFYHYYPSKQPLIPKDQPGIMLTEDSLMIHVDDFRFFVELYDVMPREKGHRAGRPSIMPQIIDEHLRRIQRGEAGKNRQQEAALLRMWAEINFKNDPIPTRDSIRNALIEHGKKKKAVM